MVFSFNYWFLQTVAMLVTVCLLPGLKVTSLFGATGMVVALALVNSFLWDAGLFFSVPASLSTHALFILAANGALFWVLVKLLPGIEIEGVLSAFLAPVVFTLSSAMIWTYAKDIDWLAVFATLADGVQSLRDYLVRDSLINGVPPEAVPVPE